MKLNTSYSRSGAIEDMIEHVALYLPGQQLSFHISNEKSSCIRLLLFTYRMVCLTAYFMNKKYTVTVPDVYLRVKTPQGRLYRSRIERDLDVSRESSFPTFPRRYSRRRPVHR